MAHSGWALVWCHRSGIPFPGPECSISKGMTLGLRSGSTSEHLPLRRAGPTGQRRAMMEPIAWLMCLAGG